MELNGDILVAAPRDKVWAALNDPQVLARCIPGCESMEATSDTERTARVAVKVGPVRARFTGHLRLQDVRPGEGCTLQFEGSGGAAGMAKGQSSVSLSEEGEGTRLRYTAQASVGGKLGQVGGRMIDAAAKQMADQFFEAFQAELAPAAAGEAAAPIAAPTPSVAPVPPDEAGAPARTAPPTPIARPMPAHASPVPGEGVRVLWFALGALSTGFGVWIASLLSA
ncbi:MAG: carbon monoxide dehydrogenase [Hydrogenophaga sp.]|uniref:CoxG family protein n=1 Tax=Hydrogenophaga sp. TaxID=1904254 RepID=UPI0016ABC5A4|nr:carbon monoxide dehydrogenase subunit G [Hydrogenophaga sp.]NIM41407.1 carbon monoxide dehydrogenase [Hydrogenophaga sp.]NIN26723.1 carbon monoxide dehydrogenase [Hydrogenophaga sp.]NIN30045.1 carbon monoxide dehydrogenase [Hydrogenophaga sp.]NIN55653.1 carbon monoxide dehydrogenase [Hydrogenophaga sp.]NIO52650.1 carbon monoxide dehydrogenase [Hydrogenophaga sp.]